MQKIKPCSLVLVLGFLLLLFFYREYLLQYHTATFHQQSIQILSKTIATDNERYAIAMQQINEETSNITKSHSWPLLRKIRNLDRTRAVVNELVAKILEKTKEEKPITIQQKRLFLQELDQLAKTQDYALLGDFRTMFLNSYKILGLPSKEEAFVVIKKEEEAYKNQKEQYTSINQSGIKDDAHFTLKVLLFQANRLQQIKFFEDLFLGYLHGRPMCNFGEGRLFPLIHSTKNCIAQGSYIEVEIGVGTYYPNIDPTLVTIIVEGDTLSIDKQSGMAKFKRKASEKGLVELNVACHATNPLTGESSVVENVIEYDVH